LAAHSQAATRKAARAASAILLGGWLWVGAAVNSQGDMKRRTVTQCCTHLYTCVCTWEGTNRGSSGGQATRKKREEVMAGWVGAQACGVWRCAPPGACVSMSSMREWAQCMRAVETLSSDVCICMMYELE
jgi:hypothetical protein